MQAHSQGWFEGVQSNPLIFLIKKKKKKKGEKRKEGKKERKETNWREKGTEKEKKW